MKQDETDPTGDLDAGWDEDDEPVESGRTAALPVSGRGAIVKPVSGAPPADETDEFDAAWVTPDPATPHGEAPKAEGLDGGWEVVGAGAGAGAGQPVDQGPRGAARVSFKKAHRQLRLKNQEQALRSKKTRKAERKAKRREEARQSRQRREEEARLARELKARRDQEKRARAKQHVPPKAATPKKAAERARPASEQVPRSESAKRPQQTLGNAPGASKKKRKQAQRQRRARVRLAVIVLVGLVVVALVAWRLAVS